MSTPASIVPEWYLLPYYAILRSIPNKLIGVIAMFGSLLILLALPLLDTSRLRGNQFRPLMKLAFWIFVVTFILLLWIGSQHPNTPYLEIGQIFTVYYFAHFILVTPATGIMENSLHDVNAHRMDKIPLDCNQSKFQTIRYNNYYKNNNRVNSGLVLSQPHNSLSFGLRGVRYMSSNGDKNNEFSRKLIAGPSSSGSNLNNDVDEDSNMQVPVDHNLQLFWQSLRSQWARYMAERNQHTSSGDSLITDRLILWYNFRRTALPNAWYRSENHNNEIRSHLTDAVTWPGTNYGDLLAAAIPRASSTSLIQTLLVPSVHSAFILDIGIQAIKDSLQNENLSSEEKQRLLDLLGVLEGLSIGWNFGVVNNLNNEIQTFIQAHGFNNPSLRNSSVRFSFNHFIRTGNYGVGDQRVPTPIINLLDPARVTDFRAVVDEAVQLILNNNFSDSLDNLTINLAEYLNLGTTPLQSLTTQFHFLNTNMPVLIRHWENTLRYWNFRDINLNLVPRPHMTHFQEELVERVMTIANRQPWMLRNNVLIPYHYSSLSPEDLYLKILELMNQYPISENSSDSDITNYVRQIYNRLLVYWLSSNTTTGFIAETVLPNSENIFKEIYHNQWSKNNKKNVEALLEYKLTKSGQWAEMFVNSSKATKNNSINITLKSVYANIRNVFSNIFNFVGESISNLICLISGTIFYSYITNSFQFLTISEILGINPYLTSIIPIVLISKKFVEIYLWFESIPKWDLGHTFISIYFFGVFVYIAGLLLFGVSECPYIQFDFFNIFNFNTFSTKNIIIWSIPLIIFDLKHLLPKTKVGKIFVIGTIFVLGFCFLKLTVGTVSFYCLMLNLFYVFYKK